MRSGGRRLQYRGSTSLEAEELLKSTTQLKAEELLKSISEHVTKLPSTKAELVGLRIQFREALESFLQPHSEMNGEWFLRVAGSDHHSALIQQMLFTTLGIDRATPTRDPETLQIIIDTLCKTSVPYTLRLIYYLARAIEFLPVPSERFAPKFTEFWNQVEQVAIPMRDEDEEIYPCFVLAEAHMRYVHSVGDARFSRPWKSFLKKTLPADQHVNTEPFGRSLLSWTTLFDKHESHGLVEDAERRKRIDASNERLIGLALAIIADGAAQRESAPTSRGVRADVVHVR